jgi:hypothetical protein
MAKTRAEITREMEDHVRSRGGAYSSWYVGVATDPEQRLFNDHNVSRENGYWIYRWCANSSDARGIEDYFIRKGMQGGPGGGDKDTSAVYAYKITISTKE